MRLPKCENAFVDVEKVRDYLLSTSHPVGRMKAAFFMALGYPSGRTASLQSVWIVRHGEDFPRFITAFADDEA